MTHPIKVLDCTLRDGGYYNNWDFSRDLVSFYLTAMGNAKVDSIEIGFRVLDKNGFMGPFAYSTDDFLGTLNLPKGPMIGVMVNAKELIAFPGGPVKAVDHLFVPKKDSPVTLVRVAAYFAEIEKSAPIVRRLKELGYRIGFNFMQTGGKSAEEIALAAAMVADWNAVEALYFADSLGNMSPCDTASTCTALKKSWKGEIGFHAHDNMGQALANCLAAIEAGATWLDGTILGMGRGAGNVRTEHLLIELNNRKLKDCYPEAVFPIALEHFEELRRQHGWGMNLLYYLSATQGIHPTYVQELLQNQRFEAHHKISALAFLQKMGGYSGANLERAVLHPQGGGEGTWSAKGWAQGRDILLIAPGPGTSRHLNALTAFIDRTHPVVICLNANEKFPSEKVTAYAACHQARLLLDSDRLKVLTKPLIAPLGIIPEGVRDKFKNVEVLNYGMTIEANTFKPGNTGSILPTSLVAGYALSLAVASGAKRVLLAGFDGFGPADPRHTDMNHTLACYEPYLKTTPLLAVTPTTYPVAQGSIYSPDL